jgi:ubiquinone/menaquinone biosynthesis C-methylase UbiE
VDGQVTELASAFPWSTITAGPVVDVGGGSGHISIALARQFPTLHSIVQDISPIQISQSQSHLDPKVSSRISFVQHDFFSPQPVYAPPPSAFLIRQVLHNYNDEDCIKILRNIVPAMERCAPGTPLLINDVVMPESGEVTKFEEHNQRQMDFCMLVIFGAKQRTVSEFSGLLKRADERLEVKRSVMRRLGMGLVEVILRS